VFPLTRTTTVSTSRKGSPAAAREAESGIQATLSAFYDAAFMDPKARKQGLPPASWKAFAEPLQQRAKADAASLTLGEAASGIQSLSVTDASLSVRLLLDPQGHPDAAVATVIFDASGKLAGGEPVAVSNRATFLLRPSGDAWLVVGYPGATTTVDSVPSPSPGAATPSSTASATPSPGASP
jgi:ketosteroid isomerase-like protein